MNSIKPLLVTGLLMITWACHTHKNTQTSAPAAVTTPASTTPATPVVVSPSPMPEKPYAPGDAELAAIRAEYSTTTMEQLQQGYMLYTQGACISCHGAQSITLIPKADWKRIIDDMAGKARLSEPQKNAVYSYVMSIKAVQKN